MKKIRLPRLFNLHNNIVLDKNDKEKKKTSIVAYQDWKLVAQGFPVVFPEIPEVKSLIEFNSELYGIIGDSGRLLKWNGTDAWVQVAAPWGGGATSNASLVVFNSKLYGVARGDGTLQQFTGNAWVQVAPALAGNGIHSNLVVFNNKIYAGTTGVLADLLYEWNGVNAWVQVASHLNQSEIDALVVYNNQLYASASGSTGNPVLYCWNGVNAWVSVLPRAVDVNGSIDAMVVFNGKLYAVADDGGSSFAELWKWDGFSPTWKRVSDSARSPVDVLTLLNLVQYNGSLFAGTNGRILMRWNGVDSWIKMTPYVSSKSVFALAVYHGNLYASIESELYEFFFSVTKTETSESTGTSISVTDSVGVRVNNVRHVTTLTPWIA